MNDVLTADRLRCPAAHYVPIEIGTGGGSLLLATFTGLALSYIVGYYYAIASYSQLKLNWIHTWRQQKSNHPASFPSDKGIYDKQIGYNFPLGPQGHVMIRRK